MPDTDAQQRHTVPIMSIRLNGNLRQPDPEKVQQIAQSIQTVGLLHPLVLSSDYCLLAGTHRLEALKLLRYEEADCQIVPFPHNSIEAKLFAVDENLMRKELTVLEQAEYLFIREELLNEMRSHANLSNPSHDQDTLQQHARDGALVRSPSASSQMARDTGISHRVARLRLRIARNLTPQERDMIRHTPLADQQKELTEVARIKHPERRTGVIQLMIGDDPPGTISEAIRKYRIAIGEISPDHDIIKPSNWWAFGRPKWQRVGFSGSIPGEVYANALYYFAPEKGIAADGMAGSGMLRRVYNDRRLWQRDRTFDLDIRLFDLYPREPFASRYGIGHHNMARPLLEQVDWLFLDPPYFRIAAGLYDGALAQTRDYEHYRELMRQVIDATWQSLKPHGIFCLFITSYVNITDPKSLVLDVPADLRELAIQRSFVPAFRVYVSRGEQQTRAAGIMNIKAKANRRMFSDVCELLVFRKTEVSCDR
jgi:hypothetical protein